MKGHGLREKSGDTARAKKNGNAAENRVRNILEKVIQNNPKFHFYWAQSLNDRKAEILKVGKKGYQVDSIIFNEDNKMVDTIEVKSQEDGGNAYERLYRYFAASSLMTSIGLKVPYSFCSGSIGSSKKNYRSELEAIYELCNVSDRLIFMDDYSDVELEAKISKIIQSL